MKWEPTLLTPGSPVYVRDLDMDFLEERLRARKPFSFWKLNHAHWELLLRYYRSTEGDSPIEREVLLSSRFCEGFARWMLKEQRFYPCASPEAFVEVLTRINTLLSTMPYDSTIDSNYYIGVSDSSVWDYKNINGKTNSKHKVSVRGVNEIIRGHLPLDHSMESSNLPVRGTLFKKAYRQHRKRLESFVATAAHGFPTLYVGNIEIRPHLRKKIAHIPTHPHNNLSASNAILDKIRAWHATLDPGAPKIIFFKGGHTQALWIDTLYQELENTYLLDVGQALDPLVRHSHISKRWERVGQ